MNLLKNIACLMFLYAMFSTSTAFAQSWVPIMQPGDYVEYFRYGAPADAPNPADRRFEEGMEQWWADKTTTSRPPYGYDWNRIPFLGNVVRSSCQIVNQPNKIPNPLYWVGTTYGSHAGDYPVAAAQEFNISTQLWTVRGFNILAEFNYGAAVSPGYPNGEVLEAAFFTDRRCTDGGREYGFFNLRVSNQFYFYYSDYTNCGASVCNTDQYGHGMGLDAAVRLFPIRNLQSYWNGSAYSYRYNYEAFFDGSNNFVVQIVNPNTGQLPLCKIISPSGAQLNQWPNPNCPNPCQATITPEGFFTQGGAVNGTNGWMAVVIQQANGGSTVPPPKTTFQVDSVMITH